MAAPTYDPYLQFNPTFKWGGRSWGASDQEAFMKALGPKKYAAWLRKHPTAGKVFDPVEQQTYGILKPQLDAINYERQKAQLAATHRLHDLAGFTQAIMGMLGEISPALRGTYTAGANTMSAGGTGYGDVLNQNMAANAAKDNSLLEVLGSPARVEGGDAGSVLAGLAGWLPSEMLGKQGAAYADAAAQLPKEASFQSQIEAKNILDQAQQTDQDFSQQVMDVLNGLPNVRAQIQDQIQQRNLATQKFKLDQLKEQHDYYMQQQALLLSQNKYKLAAEAGRRADAAEKRYEYESQGRDYMGNPKPGYTEDPKTGLLIPPGYKVDAHGNVVKTYKGSSGSKGLTPNERQALIEKIAGKEDEIKTDVTTAISNGEWFVGVGPSRPGDRERLGRKLFEKYRYLAATPTAKKALRKLINRVLNEAAKAAARGKSAAGGNGAGTPSSSGDFWGD